MEMNIWTEEYNVTSHQDTTAMAEQAPRRTATAAGAWSIRNIDVITRCRGSVSTLSGDLF
jgi:hypothetical protein